MTTKAKPFVQAAVFCEQVVIDADGVANAMRIVDTYYVNEVPPNAPPGMIRGIEVQGLISLKSGDVVGPRTIMLIAEDPLGDRREVSPAGGWQVSFKGGAHGVSIKLDFGLPVNQFGVCWFDLLADGELITRMPLVTQPAAKQ
jgi:hypothetical protein